MLSEALRQRGGWIKTTWAPSPLFGESRFWQSRFWQSPKREPKLALIRDGFIRPRNPFPQESKAVKTDQNGASLVTYYPHPEG